jgi:aldehyde:ferredoxin oxidoreductase
MAGGFFGKIMFINLKTRTWHTEELDEQVYRDYIGGYGLGARILYEHIRPGIDPLGPENILGFMAGLFVGTKTHVTGRFNVVAKSPLTGGWGDAGCGGKFGPFLKATGFDGIFFEDVSPEPVYVSVFNDEVKFHDASHVWGLDSADAENVIKEEMGKEYSVCTSRAGGREHERHRRYLQRPGARGGPDGDRWRDGLERS